jgi:hypothetical protein
MKHANKPDTQGYRWAFPDPPYGLNFCYSTTIMHRKEIRLKISLVVIMLLAWSQFVVAAHACSRLSPAANDLVRMPATMQANCSGMDGPSGTKDSPSQCCLAHCEQSAQSHQVSVPDLPSVSLVALFAVPAMDPRGPWSSPLIRPSFLFLTEGSPPLRIRYQVFRI